MKISRLTWLLFISISIISLSLWFRFSYPQLAFTNLSIDRNQALQMAKNYLKENNINPSEFKSTTIFEITNEANRYLQRTIGFDGLTKFVKEHHFDMFYWIIRFFKESENDSHLFIISSSTGKIISYRHYLNENVVIKPIDKDKALQKALSFLKDRFDFDPEMYILKGDVLSSHDYRSDYSFSWMKKDIQIPWNEEPLSGFGKLITSLTISGEEILAFSYAVFKVPEQFSLDINKKMNIGHNLLTIIRIIFIVLFIGSIYFVAARHNNLAMHMSKRFYICVVFISFFLSLLSSLNQFQQTLSGYNPASPLRDYLWRIIIETIIGALFATVTVLTPGLAGELLHFEQFQEKKEGSFLYYIRTTFFSRRLAELICLGYFVCAIMLGLQAILIEIGKNFCGVWTEYFWTTQMTTAYLPFLAALTIGYKASIYEEILYRVFTISWFKKIFKNTFLAAFLASMLWGFSHSGYNIFPMWFRGIEVTFLGFFLSFIYLRYGIIPVLIAHYLFDIFWSTAGYLLGLTKPFYSYNALGVLFLPLVMAVIAFFINKKIEEKPLQWHLTKHQIFNLKILKLYLIQQWDEFKNIPREQLKEMIISHGWDVAVVDIAIESIEEDTRRQSI